MMRGRTLKFSQYYMKYARNHTNLRTEIRDRLSRLFIIANSLFSFYLTSSLLYNKGLPVRRSIYRVI